MRTASKEKSTSFLQGGGEMGELTRSKNWDETSVGAINKWPQSLRTALSIILNSRFPMFLFWGPDFICFYNDAYRPSLGNAGKHPSILGQRGEEGWPEIWPIIKPLIDQVMSGGDATWSENQLIPIYRNGQLEDVYWTFSYSPVNDETGNPAGVFVTCSETTQQVQALGKLEASELRFRNLVRQAPISTSTFRGPELVVELANDEALKLWGKDKSILGKKVIEAIPELKGQPYMDILEGVYRTGKTYEGKENLAWLEKNGKLEPVYVNFIYKALHDSNGAIDGILSMGYDVTEQVMARKKIEELEERTRLAIDAKGIGVYDFNIATNEVIFSEEMHKIYGSLRPLPVDEYIKMIHPDDVEMRRLEIEKALITGNFNFQFRIIHPNGAIRWLETTARVYFDEHGKPVRRIGTMEDITEKKNLSEKLKETEMKFRDTVMQAPVGITILRGEDFIVEMANPTYLMIADKTENTFVGKKLFDSLPEVKETIEPLLLGVLRTGVPFVAAELEVSLNRYGKQEKGYFNLVYHPLKEMDGSISGIMVVATDVTEMVRGKQMLEESEKQFRNLIAKSPAGMAVFSGEDWIIELPNNAILQIWMRKKEEVEGKKLLDVFPELNDQQFPALLEKVYKTGISYKENEAVGQVETRDGMKTYYLDLEFSPLFDDVGEVSAIMVTVNDVTEKVEARQEIKASAERLRLATEGTLIATWDLDLVTKEIIHSPRLAIIFGHDESVHITHPDMRKQIHDEDRIPIVEKAFADALESGIYYYEARVVHPDKSIHWIQTHGKVIFEDNGDPLRMLGTMSDVTERKRTEQLIEENQKRFRLLADSMPQHIWTGDVNGNLNYFNKSVYDYSGLSVEQVDADGWIQIVHPEDRDENIKRWIHSITTGEPFLFEHRFLRHDGQYRWQLSRAIPQKDDAGQIQMWVGTSTDIDDIKKHEQQKDDFIKMASHELKTPVTTIKGYVQLLLNMHKSGTDPLLTNSLVTIDKQIGKLTKLITDLLDVTKIETGSFELNKERFSINELITEISGELQTTTPTHKIISDMPEEIYVNADRDRISQVLINLLTNAIKYSPKAENVFVRTDKSAGMVTASIKDSGIGIMDADHEKIFERFYRVKGAYEKTFPGFGIGLFIVKEIITMHGGRVWVESEKNNGATFHFSLPLA